MTRKNRGATRSSIGAVRADGGGSGSACWDRGYARLAAAVLEQAVREARSGNINSAEWLASDAAAFFCESLGLRPDVFRQASESWPVRPFGRVVIRLDLGRPGDMIAKIPREWLEELRAVVEKHPEAPNSSLILELCRTDRNGEAVVSEVINLRTGRPVRFRPDEYGEQNFMRS